MRLESSVNICLGGVAKFRSVRTLGTRVWSLRGRLSAVLVLLIVSCSLVVVGYAVCDSPGFGTLSGGGRCLVLRRSCPALGFVVVIVGCVG